MSHGFVMTVCALLWGKVWATFVVKCFLAKKKKTHTRKELLNLAIKTFEEDTQQLRLGNGPVLLTGV